MDTQSNLFQKLDEEDIALQLVVRHFTSFVNLKRASKLAQKETATRKQLWREAREKRRNVYVLPASEDAYTGYIYDATSCKIKQETYRKVVRQASNYIDVYRTNNASRKFATLNVSGPIMSGQLMGYLRHLINPDPYTGMKFLRTITGTLNGDRIIDTTKIDKAYLSHVARMTSSLFRNQMIHVGETSSTADEVNMEDVIGILMLYEDISSSKNEETDSVEIRLDERKVAYKDMLKWLDKRYPIATDGDSALLGVETKRDHINRAIRGLKRIMMHVDIMRISLEKHTDKSAAYARVGQDTTDRTVNHDYGDDDREDDGDDDDGGGDDDDEDDGDDDDECYATGHENNEHEKIPWRYWSDDLVYDGEEESLRDKSLWHYNYTAKLDYLNKVPMAAIPLVEINQHVSHANGSVTNDVFFEDHVWERMKTNILRHTWDDTSHRTIVLIIGCLVSLLYSLYRNNQLRCNQKAATSDHEDTINVDESSADAFLRDELLNANVYDRNFGDLFPGFIVYILQKWTARNDCFNLQRMLLSRYSREANVATDATSAKVVRLHEEMTSLKKYMEIGLNNISNTQRDYQQNNFGRFPEYFQEHIKQLVYPIVYAVKG